MAMLGTLSAGSTCTDPLSGDMVICPPGTQCDPAGSGQCVGTVAQGTTVCPVGSNLTEIGDTCQCPTGYEYDANQNQCVPGEVGLFAVSPGNAPLVTVPTPATVSASASGLIGVAIAGLIIWMIFARGGGIK